MAYQIEPNAFSEKKMSLREASYLAGLFDGEGSIYLIARKGRGRRSHHFVVEMTIGNSNLKLLRWVRDTTGNGRIAVNKKPISSVHKPVYSWQLAPNQIRQILPQILPYLIAKRRQAEIVIECLEIQRRHSEPGKRGYLCDEDIPALLALRAELQQLNHRGLTEVEAIEFRLTPAEARPSRICSIHGCDDVCYRAEEQCYKHWLQVRQPTIKPCEYCGAPMDAILPKKRFCTPRCQWQSSYERRTGKTLARRAEASQ